MELSQRERPPNLREGIRLFSGSLHATFLCLQGEQGERPSQRIFRSRHLTQATSTDCRRDFRGRPDAEPSDCGFWVYSDDCSIFASPQRFMHRIGRQLSAMHSAENLRLHLFTIIIDSKKHRFRHEFKIFSSLHLPALGAWQKCGKSSILEDFHICGKIYIFPRNRGA